MERTAASLDVKHRWPVARQCGTPSTTSTPFHVRRIIGHPALPFEMSYLVPWPHGQQRTATHSWRGTGIVLAIPIGLGWWALALYAYSQHGFKGLGVVIGVSILSVTAAAVNLR